MRPTTLHTAITTDELYVALHGDKADPNDRLLSTEGVAEFLSVHRRTVERYRNDGRLVVACEVASGPRYWRSHVQRMAAANVLKTPLGVAVHQSRERSTTAAPGNARMAEKAMQSHATGAVR